MRIIEHTPINLGNDDCDIVNAFIYSLRNSKDSYALHIDYPVSERITSEFRQSDIDALWDKQYPEWIARLNAYAPELTVRDYFEQHP